MGVLSNKGGRGQRNHEEIGAGANFYRARISRRRHSCARLEKTAMLRRLNDSQRHPYYASQQMPANAPQNFRGKHPAVADSNLQIRGGGGGEGALGSHPDPEISWARSRFGPQFGLKINPV